MLAVVSHLFWTEYFVEILNSREDNNQNDGNCKQLGFLKTAEPQSIFSTFCTDPISDGQELFKHNFYSINFIDITYL